MNNEVNTQVKSYLTFKLGDEVFAANVSKVLNILELTKITKVPKAPAYMKGVINLRGSVLPLIDTRIKFGMSETEFTNNTCILVLDIILSGESVRIGALVDAVHEVLEIDDSQILPPPSLGSKYKSEFIDGMVKLGEEFIMLLNVELIFSTDDILNLKEVTGEVKQKFGDAG
ncbi:MAG: purine-binding chemotaxis protein CheW [Bacteroidales bacterium]|nr:purine-binding chemotaxis protein CheW [Bacteroidales bacterium]